MPRSQPPTARLAMALVVRDEERFLGANLAYHQALGVSRAYVYLDRCTDGTPEVAASFDWVESIPQNRGESDAYMSSFQVRCLDDALARARAEGFDWLLHLDPDEFAWGENRPGWFGRLIGRRAPTDLAERGSLTTMLGKARPETEMVMLRPKEVLPQRVEPGSPFWRLHYFQDRGILKRPVLDPTTGEIRQLDLWIGNHWGKSLVRTSANVRAESAHGWTRANAPDGTSIPTQQLGFHYHFVVVDSEQWSAKYRKFAEFPDRWSSGRPVRFPKQAWKVASQTMSAEEARRYFDEWVAVSPEVLRRKTDGRRVVRETFVEDILSRVHPPAAVREQPPPSP